MASDMSSLGRASSRSASGGASISSGSVSTFSSSKKIDDAKHLSRATTQATLAAKSILASGGTEETALKTAKAAAQATLLQSHIGTAAFTGMNKGGPSAFLCRRKIKRQSEVVASMALMTATNELNRVMRSVPKKDDSTISKMSINVDEQAQEHPSDDNDKQPSPLTVATTHGQLLPTILSEGDNEAAAEEESENGNQNDNDRDDVSKLSMDSAPPREEKEKESLGTRVLNNSTDDVTEIKDSFKPRGKKAIQELKKGALSLDSTDTDNVEAVNKDGSDEEDNEAKENAAPIQESPTLVIAPSPKAIDEASQGIPYSPRGKPPPFRLVVQPTRTSQPLEVISPMNSVKANLIEKRSLPKSILTPSETYFTQGMNSPQGAGKRQGSPSRMQMMQSPRFERKDADDDTIECEPVYIMERNPKYEQNSHSGSTRGERSEDQSYDSSEGGSSFFSSPSMETFETTQTSVTNTGESEGAFLSVLSNMLKCGATLNRSMGRGEKTDTLTPHEKSVYKAWKNKSIIVDTNPEKGGNDMLIGAHLAPTTPGIQVPPMRM